MLVRAGLVLLVIAVAGGGVWLYKAATEPEQSPIEVPAASVPVSFWARPAYSSHVTWSG